MGDVEKLKKELHDLKLLMAQMKKDERSKFLLSLKELMI